MLGKIEGKTRRGRQRIIRWLDSFTDSMDMILSKLSEAGKPVMLQFMRLKRVGRDLVTGKQQLLKNKV